MTIVNWISNNPDVALLIATTIGGWLGITKKNNAAATLKEKLLSKLRQELHALCDELADMGKARQRLEWVADALLDQLGKKRDAVTDHVVEFLIEQALQEYSALVGPRVLQARMDELHAKLGDVAKAFDSEESTIPKLDLDIEVVPPDQKFTTFAEDEAAKAAAAELVRTKLAKAKAEEK